MSRMRAPDCRIPAGQNTRNGSLGKRAKYIFSAEIKVGSGILLTQ
ncbi:MAG: hypothetical protein NVS9B13_13620 [Candidatus Acidiferrum sp.]